MLMRIISIKYVIVQAIVSLGPCTVMKTCKWRLINLIAAVRLPSKPLGHLMKPKGNLSFSSNCNRGSNNWFILAKNPLSLLDIGRDAHRFDLRGLSASRHLVIKVS
jgi:hypothetical protein